MFGLGKNKNGVSRDVRLVLGDVYDVPSHEGYQAAARKVIKDGQTLTWDFSSWCRGTQGTYTATRVGDRVTVTRNEHKA